MKLLSEKLLSTIFNENVDFVDESIIHRKTGLYLGIRFKEGDYHDMSLGHLLDKCTTWMIEQPNVEYVDISYSKGGSVIVEIVNQYGNNLYGKRAKTAHDAIFEATEWLINNPQ